jgi:hypothetical protein
MSASSGSFILMPKKLDIDPTSTTTPPPSKFHLDVMVDDLDDAERQILVLGAKRPHVTDRVFGNRPGHPICLIPRPNWEPPTKAGELLYPDTGDGQEQPDRSCEQQ